MTLSEIIDAFEADYHSFHLEPSHMAEWFGKLRAAIAQPMTPAVPGTGEREAFEAWRKSVLHLPRSVSPLKAWFARASLAAQSAPVAQELSDDDICSLADRLWEQFQVIGLSKTLAVNFARAVLKAAHKASEDSPSAGQIEEWQTKAVDYDRLAGIARNRRMVLEEIAGCTSRTATPAQFIDHLQRLAQKAVDDYSFAGNDDKASDDFKEEL